MNILTILKDTDPSVWIQLVFILTFTAILGVVARRVLNNLKGLRSSPEWARTLCDSFYTPSAWLIWGYGILLSIEVTVNVTHMSLSSELIAKVRNIFFILFASWTVLSWKGKYEAVLKNRVRTKVSKAQDELLIMAVGRVFTIFIVLMTGMIVLDIMGVQLTALLAFGGVGGVAVGFAAKDIVANFFGGFMIFINRHFTVGEWIMSPNKHFEGFVEDIGWYMTRIRTFTRRPMFIPNALFIDAVIENPGRMYNRRIKETIGIRYGDMSKLEAIVQDIRVMLRQHKGIDQEKPPMVHFMKFGSSSLDIDVTCFTITTDREKWRDIQQDIFIKIAGIINSMGAEIAFPTSTVYYQGDAVRKPEFADWNAYEMKPNSAASEPQ